MPGILSIFTLCVSSCGSRRAWILAADPIFSAEKWDAMVSGPLSGVLPSDLRTFMGRMLETSIVGNLSMVSRHFPNMCSRNFRVATFEPFHAFLMEKPKVPPFTRSDRGDDCGIPCLFHVAVTVDLGVPSEHAPPVGELSAMVDDAILASLSWSSALWGRQWHPLPDPPIPDGVWNPRDPILLSYAESAIIHSETQPTWRKNPQQPL